jgi:hypothetical protein
MEKDRLRFCIERFDHYYDSINNKSAVFLALGTFIVGGLTASISFLRKNVDCSTTLYVLLSFSILFGVSSLLIVLYASLPFLSKKSSSLFFFNSIALKDKASFLKESECYNNEEEIKDLREQVYCLAYGLRKKFRLLRLAGIFYGIVFLSMIPVIFLIVNNLK